MCLCASRGRDPLAPSHIHGKERQQQRALMGICSQKPLTVLVLEKWEKDAHTGFTGLSFSRDCESQSKPTAALLSGRSEGRK